MGFAGKCFASANRISTSKHLLILIFFPLFVKKSRLILGKFIIVTKSTSFFDKSLYAPLIGVVKFRFIGEITFAPVGRGLAPAVLDLQLFLLRREQAPALRVRL
jgi:hypothetical protein